MFIDNFISYKRGCCNLTEIDIPQAVTEIGDMAFQNCYRLKKVNMSNAVTKIGEYAFSGCSNLAVLNMP